jgi:tight adherence protein C
MQTQELIVYLFIVGAFLAVGWMFASRDDEGSSSFDHEPGWSKLPLVFRATWGFVTFFEQSLGAMLADLMPKRAKRFAELAVISALPLSANRVLAASCALGLIGLLFGIAAAAALYVAVPSSWSWLAALVALGFFAMGWFWPGQNLAHYAEDRQQKLTRELPFSIDLIGGAMRSGLEFGAAMRYYISLKTGGPLEEEFGRVLADVTLGRPFIEALGDMARRVKLEAFTSFVSVVSYGMEIGAPIAQTLKMHGSDLRRERSNLAERKAARAPSVMILPLVLFIMPSVFIIVLTPMIIRFMKTF